MADQLSYWRYWRARKREQRVYRKSVKRRFREDPASFNPYN